MSGDDRLAQLERRLRAVEDELAILRLIASYGPAVDRGDAAATAALWDADGSYSFSGGATLVGADAVGDLVEIPQHQEYLAQGCAHVLSLPVVTLDGDRSTAVNYSRLYLRDGEHWRVERASANHWTLVRTASGWRVRSRVNRLLDGAVEHREVLAASR